MEYYDSSILTEGIINSFASIFASVWYARIRTNRRGATGRGVTAPDRRAELVPWGEL
jgi:hypothetical protein